MVKNLPINAGDTGSIPGPGKSHIPWSKPVHHDAELMALEPVLCNKRSHHNEEPER